MRIYVILLFLITISAVAASDPQMASTKPAESAVSPDTPQYWLEKAYKYAQSENIPYCRGSDLVEIADLYIRINLPNEAVKILDEAMICVDKEQNVEYGTKLIVSIAELQAKMKDKLACIQTLLAAEIKAEKIATTRSTVSELVEIAKIYAKIQDKAACIRTLQNAETRTTVLGEEYIYYWVCIGEIYVDIGESKTVEKIEFKIKKINERSYYLLSISQYFYGKGMCEKADEYLKKAEVYGISAESREQLLLYEAEIDVDKGDFESARKKVGEIANYDTRNMVLVYIAKSARDAGNQKLWDQMIDQVRKSIDDKNAKENKITYLRLIKVYCEVGQIDKAEELVNKLQEKINQAWAWTKIAKAQIAANKISAARSSLETALKLVGTATDKDKPRKNDGYLASISEGYAMLGDFDRALEIFGKTHSAFDPIYIFHIAKSAIKVRKFEAVEKWVDTLEGYSQPKIWACRGAAEGLIPRKPASRSAAHPASIPASKP
ncbi:MAG: hypothetical protein HZA50_00350 [Planctomycetes bacterium]|nr:hypothetical protein [Planctomycetota bacterium]